MCTLQAPDRKTEADLLKLRCIVLQHERLSLSTYSVDRSPSISRILGYSLDNNVTTPLTALYCIFQRCTLTQLPFQKLARQQAKIRCVQEQWQWANLVGTCSANQSKWDRLRQLD